MRNAWIPPWPQKGKGVPLLLIPEYSVINKGQRVPDRPKTAHTLKKYIDVKRHLEMTIKGQHFPQVLPRCSSASPPFY